MKIHSGFGRPILVGLLAAWSGTASTDPHGWPVVPVNRDHPVGNTLGEVIRIERITGPRTYHHEGLDILVAPDGTDGAPDVVVTVAGVVVDAQMIENGRDNWIRIAAADGKTFHVYNHLEYWSLSQLLLEHLNETSVDEDGDPKTRQLGLNGSNPLLMNPGDRIGKVRNAFVCDYDHLHYQIDEKLTSGKFLTRNPLLGIEPNPDEYEPEVKIHLAKRVVNGDVVTRTKIELEAAPACTIVTGDVDIIAEVHDRDDARSAIAGAGNVGLYDLKWRACLVGSPDCDWNMTHTYDSMPPEWQNSGSVKNPAPTRFSFESPWETKPEPWLRPEAGEQCPFPSDDRTFVILTSFESPGPWHTAEAEGKYVLSVKASDLAANETISSIKVCIEQQE
jgi:hypothetical protein